MILEPEYLDSIYRHWLAKQDSDDPYRWRIDYYRQPRITSKNQRFEEWLFEQGFTVIQKDKKRYLKFSGDEKRLTWFLLKHGVTL